MINRLFKQPDKLSFFLFGARGTGKTTLLNERFLPSRSLWFDLLDQDLESRFQLDPMAFEREILAREKDASIEWIVIDEIQKVPKLLDIVHRQIERKRFKFALTGSSARKLKRGAANLLASRAIQKFLFPLTHIELGTQFKLAATLEWGALPILLDLTESDRRSALRTYINTYLKEEVIAEQLIRNLAPFRAFLPISAQCSGTILNYSKIARDIGSDAVTVQSYFEILEDTYIGFRLPPYHRSLRKQQRKSPKFYLFDLGVTRALESRLDLPLQVGTYEYGRYFEQFLILEIHRLNQYYERDFSLSYLMTKDDVEIDLIVERPGKRTILIEIKSTDKIKEDDIRSLSKISQDFKNSEAVCLSNDPRPQQFSSVRCMHWKEGVEYLFG